CDEIWYIYAAEEIRTERLMASRGYSAGRIQRMMASQRSETSFRMHCSRTIDNSGNFEETCSQLKNAVESLK
ncbi:MAG TPA: dephospho-CoA kinase, partial [Lachnospiraceae bacterium]|nr:dephospho-CoA kinase [Lachnospiraceae bacterium]